MSFESVKASVAIAMEKVDETIAQQLGAKVELIKELGGYIFGAGGKRLRPMLVLLCAKLFSDQETRESISLAAIVELIHTATLLHDDVVDASMKRRGRKTANQLWGNDASVLVGDFLYSRSFQLMVELGDMRVLRILADASNQIAEGEVMQLANIGQLELSESAYYEVIRRKTATLFQAAAQLPAVIFQRSENEMNALANYGEALGIAFQLVDDALDYGFSETDIGKNLGDDLSEGKMTLPLIYALKTANKIDAKLIADAIHQRDVSQLDKVIAILKNTESLQYTISQAKEYAQKAQQSLVLFENNSARQALETLALFAVERFI